MVEQWKEQLENAGMNVDHTIARFMDNEKIYLKFLQKFLKDGTMGQLEEACAGTDMRAVFVAAHTLKGIAGNLGLDAMTEILVPMCDAYRDEVDETYSLEENMQQLRKRYQDICSAISQMVSEG